MRDFPDHLMEPTGRGVVCSDIDCSCPPGTALVSFNALFTFPDLRGLLELHRREYSRRKTEGE